MDRVETGTAAQIKQTLAGRKREGQPPPHLGAHVLNEVIVAARAVVIACHAVEGVLRVMQLRLKVVPGHQASLLHTAAPAPAGAPCRAQAGARRPSSNIEGTGR